MYETLILVVLFCSEAVFSLRGKTYTEGMFDIRQLRRMLKFGPKGEEVTEEIIKLHLHSLPYIIVIA
jgi:hypothetical protein